MASARKSSTPASEAIAAAVTGLSPVTITVLMPMARKRGEALLDVGLHHVLQMDDAEQPAALGDRERRAAGARDAFDGGAEAPAAPTAAAMPASLRIASTAPLRMLRPSRSTPEMRVVGGERDRLAASRPIWLGQAEIRPWRGPRSSGLPASRRQAGEQRGLGERLLVDAGHRDELGRHAVAEGDGAGLVEQQRVDVAGGLDRAARGGEDVEADQPVHAGDADGGQQPADGGRDQRDEQRREHGDREHGRRNRRQGPTASPRR